MDWRVSIENIIRQVASDSDTELGDDFGDETVLLESGLNSLDFAIVVARLEEEYKVDPFSAMDEPVYPRTLSDFVAIYERSASVRS